jgi:hypothetical protein
MTPEGATTWVLAALPDHYATTVDPGFTVADAALLMGRMHAAAGVSA